MISVNQLLANVVEFTGKSEEFSHSFFFKVKQMVEQGDSEALLKERIPLKLLRLCPHAQEGFILTDFPNSVPEAELLEQYKGGMNAFVHLTLPDEVLVDVEENKVCCGDCGKVYYENIIDDREQGIHIENFIPKSGHCGDCGSENFTKGSNPQKFEEDLKLYKSQKEELLSFYDHYVTL